MASFLNNINSLERIILLATDEDGRIPFLHWQTGHVDGIPKALTLMEAKGWLCREDGGKFYRGFRLSELGKSLREDLRIRQAA
jgi:hypothetical protein